jgi:hypothetical protein
MASQTHTPDGAPRLSPEPDRQRTAASPEHRKETFLKEVLEGLPGYYEAPPEVRKDRLPTQHW